MPENLPATQAGGALVSADDLALMSEGSKTGTEQFTIKQIVVPYLGIVQGSSDYVKPGTKTYNRDIRVGQIIDNLMQVPMEEALVVPCKYQDQWKEYEIFRDRDGKEKRGKLTKLWFNDSSGYQSASKRNQGDGDGFPRYTAEGNMIIQEPTYYCLLVDPATGMARPVVLPMGSTQTKKSRRWNGLIDALKFNGPEGPFTAPIYAQLYKLTTVPETSGDNTYSGWNITPAGLTLNQPNGRGLWVMAQAVRKQVEEGVMKGQEPVERDITEEGSAQTSAPRGPQRGPQRDAAAATADEEIPF